MSNNLIRITTQRQVPGPEVPANWQPPTLSYITRKLHNFRDVDTSPTGYTVWRPSNPSGYNPPVFDDDGLLIEANSNNEGQTPRQVSQQEYLEEGSIRVMVKYQHSYQLIKATLEMMTECLGLYEIQVETHSIRTHTQHSLMIPMMRCRM